MVGMSSNTNKLPTTVENYRILGILPGASPSEVKKAYLRASQEFHPNKVVFLNNTGKRRPATKEEAKNVTNKFTNIGAAYTRIMKSPLSSGGPSKPANNGQRARVVGNITAVKAKAINNYFRGKKLLLTEGSAENFRNRQLAPYVPPKQPNAKNNTVVAPRNTSYSGLGVGRKNNTNPTPTTNAKPGFWSRFKRPSMPSFGFGGLFKSARQKAINAGNFMPSNAFNGAKNGYEYKTNRHGRGYYRLGSFYTKNPIKGLPAMGPVAMGFPVPGKANNGGNKGPKNMGTGNGGGGRGGGGSVRVRTGNVRTGATRIGNVKSTSGSSRA
jgi:hypothetical protein